MDLGMVQTLIDDLGIQSLVDIGCGDGTATLAYRDLGLDILGIDGDYTRLPLKPYFALHDFTRGPLEIGESYDLAYSVEFLEHVEERFIPNFMPVFARCRFAVVTAARPGQNGHHHVNCREPEYWIDVFSRWGLEFDEAYTDYLKARSTFCKAAGRNAGKRVKFFQKSGMFFRKR